MPDIYIFDSDRISAEKLKEICFRHIMDKNYETEIYIDKVSINSDSGIYMLDSIGIDKYAREIWKGSSGSYIIAILQEASEIVRVVKPWVRPSGILFRPPSEEDAKDILEEIYSDIDRCAKSGNDELFRFKLKAKEYAIPYERIILFESCHKKILVRTEVQEFEYYGTLESIISSAPDKFVQIHKSFVINTEHIVCTDFGNMTVTLADGSEAYISRTFKNRLKDKLAEGGTI